MLWSLSPSDLLVGVLFGLVAHLGMRSTQPPEADACTRGWSAYENVAGIPLPRGLPCSWTSRDPVKEMRKYRSAIDRA